VTGGSNCDDLPVTAEMAGKEGSHYELPEGDHVRQ
jgi:hypothetical protein